VHKPCVLGHTAMPIVEDVEKLVWEVERPPPLYEKLKEYSDRNLKAKLWGEVYESVVTKWSELPAEQKSEKMYVNFLVHIIGDHANDANGQKRAYYKEKTQRL